MKNSTNSILTVIGLLLFSCSFSNAVAQEIPSEIQSKMNQGLDAAQADNWEEALKIFSTAVEVLYEKKIKIPPVLMFNSALASDKSPGRYMIASAWYQAYLAAVPNDENAEQIKQRSVELIEAYDQAMWSRIIEMKQVIKHVTGNIPSDYDKSGWKLLDDQLEISSAIGTVVSASVMMGDFSAVDQVAELTGEMNKFGAYDYGYRDIIGYLVRIGEYDKANGLLPRIKDVEERENAERGLQWTYREYEKQKEYIRGCPDSSEAWSNVAYNAGKYFLMDYYKTPDSQRFIDDFKKAVSDIHDIGIVFRTISWYSGELATSATQRFFFRWAWNECKKNGI